MERHEEELLFLILQILIKDSIVLPLAFINGAQHVSEQIFREDCLKYFTKHKVLDYMFTIIKEISMTTDWDLLV